MTRKKLITFLLPTLFFVWGVPQAFAGELGDAFEKTFQASDMNYSATAEMTLKKDMASDVPFTVLMKGKEEGGKKSDNYAETGEFSVRLSQFQDIPSEFADLTYVDFAAKYRADYNDTTKTAYFSMDMLKASSDSAKAQPVIDMMNEIAKMYTGKGFKLSSKELLEVLSSQMSTFGSDDMLALSALGQNSVSSMMEALGVAIDGMIESGVLIDQVTNDSSRRLRGMTGGTVHTLALAESISSQQATMLRTVLVRFVEQMFPMMASEMNAGLQYITPEELAAEINEALQAFKGAQLDIVIGVSSGMVSAVSMDMDLSSIGMPLLLKSEGVFDYSRGYDMTVPRTAENLVDLNKIVEGFMSLVSIGSSGFSGGDDGTWSDDSTGYFVVLDNIDVINDHLWTLCGDDSVCRRNELKNLRKDLMRAKREGYVSNQGYRMKLKELKSLR